MHFRFTAIKLSAEPKERRRAGQWREMFGYFLLELLLTGFASVTKFVRLGQEMRKTILKHTTVPKRQDGLRKTQLKNPQNGSMSKGHRRKLTELPKEQF